jgi:hypothetical protein
VVFVAALPSELPAEGGCGQLSQPLRLRHADEVLHEQRRGNLQADDRLPVSAGFSLLRIGGPGSSTLE